ncbi:OsmC family protein [Flavobacteriaceae bacterium]|jgi:putative redox protein|nr:OsmC family protein [Flavobacteriaceae bacterium]|tara:strand:- start:621 stop:1022 length:402 start_codon:yes stop_codon:yes gene_type:complete
MTSKVYYEGNLRTKCVHLKSGNEIITDAPVDNSGKGEAFSPTDTVATALASCMVTVMAIKAEQLGVSFINVSADVKKIMSVNPRRISKISILISLPINLSKENKEILENIGDSCPVHNSLDPKLVIDIKYDWI